MDFVTPTHLDHVAWQGELEPAQTLRGAESVQRPFVQIGRPEVWPAADALQAEVGRAWVKPLGDADFWLVRLACTLRAPGGLTKLTSAEQRVQMRPRNPRVPADAAYAFSLFPDRLSVEDKVEQSVSLGPELKFEKVADLKLGSVGAKIEYKKVFPVIQGYNVGRPDPYWVYRAHAAYPLDGSQCVYAVVAARAGAGGVRLLLTVIATLETQFGPIRFGPPEAVKDRLSFDIPG